MAGHAPYATRKHLEDRISAKTVRALLDDNRDATPDFDVVASLLRDATSRVDSFLALAPGGLLPINLADIPDEVVRLTLDVAVWMADRRHHEVMRLDWEKLKKASDDDLKAVRDGDVAVIVPSALDAIDGPVVGSCPSRYGDCSDSCGTGDDFYNNND